VEEKLLIDRVDSRGLGGTMLGRENRGEGSGARRMFPRVETKSRALLMRKVRLRAESKIHGRTVEEKEQTLHHSARGKSKGEVIVDSKLNLDFQCEKSLTGGCIQGNMEIRGIARDNGTGQMRGSKKPNGLSTDSASGESQCDQQPCLVDLFRHEGSDKVPNARGRA